LRGELEFDPEKFDYGAATLSVRRILHAWANIDWFVPALPDGHARAIGAIKKHLSLARTARPELFPEHVQVTTRVGRFAEFRSLCERVSGPGARWDWKFSALKPLSSDHSKEKGWSVHTAAREATEAAPPQRGELFLKVGGSGIWFGFWPRINLRTALPPEDAKSAGWYLGYAAVDVLECIEWQLAERSNETRLNPFLPLVHCYAERYYPFAVGPAEIVLFALSDESGGGR
jgi:hypothetical protein